VASSFFDYFVSIEKFYINFETQTSHTHCHWVEALLGAGYFSSYFLITHHSIHKIHNFVKINSMGLHFSTIIFIKNIPQNVIFKAHLQVLYTR